VLDERRFRADVDAPLDDLAPGHAEVVSPEVGAADARDLLLAAAHVSSSVSLLADIRVTRRAPLASLGQSHERRQGLCTRLIRAD
jgi:hypothetical protein